MILSNSAIFEALDDGRLVISPEPSPRFAIPGQPKPPYGTSAVDLTLGPNLAIPRSGAQVAIDLRHGGDVISTLSTLTEPRTIDPVQGFTIRRGDFVLAQTAEDVSLPLFENLTAEALTRPTLAARVEGKSSRARFGLLVHFTAPTIHAGWSGPITLEIMCLGPSPFILYPGLPICQLVIEQVAGIATDNPSQFQQQVTPVGGR
jgi:dCTP deaminase